MVTTSASQHKSPKEPKMKCQHRECHEPGCIVVQFGGTIYAHLCISHMRDFYRYVADRLEAAERADEEAERASR